MSDTQVKDIMTLLESSGNCGDGLDLRFQMTLGSQSSVNHVIDT